MLTRFGAAPVIAAAPIVPQPAAYWPGRRTCPFVKPGRPRWLLMRSAVRGMPVMASSVRPGGGDDARAGRSVGYAESEAATGSGGVLALAYEIARRREIAYARAARARSASTYELRPKPAIVPVATAAITDVCLNRSRVAGLEMCTSISGARSWAQASRTAYE